MKEHSNFVKSLGKFHTRSLTRPMGRKSTKYFKLSEFEVNNFRNANCIKCRLTVTNFISRSAAERAMITKLNDVTTRLADIEEKYKNLREKEDQYIGMCNETRLIGLLESTDSTPESIITENLLAASHLISVDSWPIELRILFLNRLQVHAQKFTESIQKSRTKKEIELHIKDLRVNEVAKSNLTIATQERDHRRKTIYKDFDKMIKGIMKSMRCDEETALRAAKEMGQNAPPDYLK